MIGSESLSDSAVNAAYDSARDAAHDSIKGPLRSGILLLVSTALLMACDVLPPMPWSSPRDDRQLFGNVDIREVQMAFRVGGRLETMLVEEGQAVVAGELVATLDDQPMRDALAVAEAHTAQAEAVLAGVRAGTRVEELRRLQAQVREMEVAHANAEKAAQRQERLALSNSTSQTAVDDARAARDRASARLTIAQQALALAHAGSRAEDIARAEAAVAATRAEAAQARSTLADSRLLAPSDGIITTRAREPGSLITAGQPVYLLTLTDHLYVRAYVDESALGRAAPGTRVSIRSDSSDKAYSGRIGFVSPRAEFTPRTVETPELRTALVYRMRVVIDDPDDALRQGMPVTVLLPAS